jgi:hypothetical protein
MPIASPNRYVAGTLGLLAPSAAGEFDLDRTSEACRRMGIVSQKITDDPGMRDAYDRLLASVGNRWAEPGPEWLTSHWPVVGADWRGGPLFVGQAVNGWIPRWRRSDAASPRRRAEIIEQTRSALSDRQDRMDWIVTNGVRSSPFWRCVRAVVETFDSYTASAWYSRVSWTNLYPIAPLPAGNPDERLRAAQQAAAEALLLETVRTLSPSAVIVLAGPFWWPFAANPVFRSLAPAARPLLQEGTAENRPWVVGWHPAGAQRHHWHARDYAATIMRALTIRTT